MKRTIVPALAAALCLVIAGNALSACPPSAAAEMDALYAAKSQYLGAPITGPGAGFGFDEGCGRRYDNGVIVWSNEAGAHEIHGLIYLKWRDRGGIDSVGYPLTDETPTPDSVGRFNHFSKNNSIYYYPYCDAHEIKGLIRHRWAEMGWEKCFLGYPKTDEIATPDGIGRFTHFQFGSIYYHPSHGTNVVYGRIKDIWAASGWERGEYGYPRSDPYRTLNGWEQVFQHGKISYSNSHIDLRPSIKRMGMSIRNQGRRGTCSVFAITFCLEYALAELTNMGYVNNLSEEFQNHVANLATGREDDGDFFHNIVDGYEEYGVAPESAWPYDTAKNAYDFSSVSLSATVYNNAKVWTEKGLKLRPIWIRPNDGNPGLTNTQFKFLKDYIERGVPIAIGRAHSMVIVGYEDNASYNGGGRFIIRNSYGDWRDDSGYVYQSYRFIQDSLYDAVAFLQPFRTEFFMPEEHTEVGEIARSAPVSPMPARINEKRALGIYAINGRRLTDRLGRGTGVYVVKAGDRSASERRRLFVKH